MRIIKIVLLFTTLHLIYPGSLIAGGTNRTPVFGARAMSLNGLYFAGVDGISNIFLNPAGLSLQGGNLFEFSYHFRSEQNQFDGDVRGLYNSLREEDGNYGIGFSLPLSDDLTVGIAYKDVFNYKVDWPYVLIIQSGQISNATATDLSKKEFRKIISPAISYRIGDFAAGLTINIVNLKVETSVPRENYNWIDSISLPLYQVDLDEDGWIWEFNFGIMYKLNQSLRLGAVVTNAVDEELTGSANSRLYQTVDSAAQKTEFITQYQSPWKVGLGIEYEISPELKLNFDFRYSLFSGIDSEVKRDFDDPVWQDKSAIADTLTGFPIRSVKQANESTIDIGLGVEYVVSPTFTLSAGYRYSQSPNADQSINLLEPGVDQHMISAGFSVIDGNIALEGSLVYFTGIKKKINSSDFAVHNGVYNTSGIIPTLTLKYGF
ncbi:MAG: outer membrane protein transport protein [Melioribacteraceae bacterium]|nr:outer membrane protein transport protein [Melioribacteraceae bacterium]